MAQPTQQDVDRVVAAYENDREAVQYASKYVMETEQVQSEEYRMIWSE